MIHEALANLAIDIDSVEPHPKNVRQGDVGMISQSLDLNGQYRPIIIQRSSNKIIAGNHTWKAAKMLGWSQIAAQFIDVDDDRALRIMLADNKANDAASYDDAELLELLSELVASDQSLEGTLFSTDDLDDLVALLSQPTLDQVIDDVGIHDGSDGFKATIKVSVALETYEEWSKLWEAQVGTDDERIQRIINLANK